MDIHRSRFVPFPPSAINALAFSHASPENNSEDPKSLRLAIGRANGNIEIWNPTGGAWLQERVFSGGKDRSVEGLAWVQEPSTKVAHNKTVEGRLRLFSIGYSSSITEWDLASGLPSRHANGSHSEVWCFAAQPRSSISGKKDAGVGANEQQGLVAGCADGTLVMLSTAEDDLRFDRFLSRSTTKKARVLSVTYKDRNIVLAGFADSMIRVFDTRSASVLRSISLGTGPPGGPKDILVWKVKCLGNGDFVSGDSTGDIRIYNGKNFSQVQRISGHEADVLDLAVSRDGSTIFSAGMDRRTCLYSGSKKKADRGEKWRKISHKRYHDHDVKAMATYEGNKTSVIVSGGIDTQPVVIPFRQFGKELSRGLPSLPHDPCLVSAPEVRLMASWWNCEMRIWRVKDQADGAEKPKVVARLALEDDENITSVSITRDGELLAVSTASEVKLFQITRPTSTGAAGLRIRKLEIPATTGARLVRLTTDGKWLAIVTTLNEVQLARVIRSEGDSERPRVLSRFIQLRRLRRDLIAQDSLNGPWGRYDRSITRAEFSSDGTILAVADLAGYIDTWVVEGHEDSTAPEVDVDDSSSASVDDDELDDDEEHVQERISIFGQRWIRNPSAHLLPRLDSSPLLLSFQPSIETSSRPEPNGNPAVHPTRHNPHPHSHVIPNKEHNLLVVSVQHKLYDFEILAGRLSDWSRRNPSSTYPSQFRQLDTPVKGCTWDISKKRRRVWLYGEKWLFMFDLSKDFLLPSSKEEVTSTNGAIENGATTSKKRKREPVKELARQANSGAGDAVPEIETPVTKIRKFNSGKSDESSKSTWIDLNSTGRIAKADDELDDDHEALSMLRRPQSQEGPSQSADKLANSELSEDEADLGPGEEHSRSREPWWHTFKYRPILGIVPIGGNGKSPEVVLVERPSWDLDLPPRFVGSRE